MLLKLYANNSGRISAIGYSHSDTYIPGDFTIASGNIIVGQEQVYNSSLPPPDDYIFTSSKGFLSFDTSSICGFINSGHRVYSCSLYFKPSAVNHDVNWSSRIKYFDFHQPELIGTNNGWVPLITDPSDPDYYSAVADDWFSCQHQINEFSVSGMSTNYYKQQINNYHINVSGLTQFKFTSDRFDDDVNLITNDGWTLGRSWKESLYINGFNSSYPPFLIIGLAGMKLLRLETISLIKHIRDRI